MNDGFVLPTSPREAIAHCQMESAADLLIIQDRLGETLDTEISADTQLAQITGALRPFPAS